MSVSLREQIIQAVERLSEEEQRRLLELIEQLGKQPKFEGSLLDFILEEADSKISLAQIRCELSAIQGNLSDVIIAEREERG